MKAIVTVVGKDKSGIVAGAGLKSGRTSLDI